MTHETINAALHNLQAQINEVTGLMRDMAKQPTQEETATNLVKYSIRLAQLEGAFITLQQHATTIVEISKQFPVIADIDPEPREAADLTEETAEDPAIVTPEMSKTLARTKQIHAATAAAQEEEE